MEKLLKSPRQLALLGLMLGLTIILDVTPLGAVPLGAISATIVHIPTIITGIILGPLAGWLLGTLFGLVSLLHALTRPVTVLDPLFINPLVSVLPRMFIGLSSFYVYKLVDSLLKRKTGQTGLGIFLGAAAGSLTNTVLVFLMLYLVYAREIVEQVGAPFKTIFLTVFTTNAVAEAVLSGVIAVPVALAYFRYTRLRTM